MRGVVVYLLLNVLASGLCWCAYRVAFRRGGMPAEQRCFLLATAVLSLLAPLCNLHLSSVVGVSQASFVAEIALPSASQSSGMEQYVLASLCIIYIVVALIKGVRFVGAQLSIRSRLKAVPYEVVEGIRYHFDPCESASFSYGRDVLVGCKGLSESEVKMVMLHEEAHVRRHHTCDLLLLNILCTVFWCNPFNRLYLNELKRLHDYEADAIATARCDLRQYAMLLVSQCESRSPKGNSMQCHFKSGDFLRRVSRLYVRPQHRPVRFLLIVPVLLLVVLLNSCVNSTSTSNEGCVVQRANASDVAVANDSVDQDIIHEVVVQVKNTMAELVVNGKGRTVENKDSTMRLTITSSNPDVPVSPEVAESVANMLSGLVIAVKGAMGDSAEKK